MCRKYQIKLFHIIFVSEKRIESWKINDVFSVLRKSLTSIDIVSLDLNGVVSIIGNYKNTDGSIIFFLKKYMYMFLMFYE